MDKLKEQLAPVLKHGFWIISALVLIGSLAIWWLASGSLIAEYETASSKIESDAQRVTSVSAKLAEHPNPKTHEEMQRLIKTREQEVLDAWTSVYKRQQEILVWPASLQEDFVREFKDLIPIELKVQYPTPEEEEKESTLLNRYRYYIGAVLPGIAEIAKTKWTANLERATSAGGGYGGGESGGDYGSDYGGGMPMGYGGVIPEEGPLVKWETASQEALVKDLFPWNGGQPTTLDVLYSQENLWILRQLMQIIASVNGDAGQRFQAKIHEINRIAIGSSVKTTAGTISKPTSDLAAGMGMEMGMGMEGSEDYSGGEGMGIDPMTGGMMGVATDPGDNRYVDTAGKPLPAATLRAALASKSPTDAFMAVAKRIPVMMSLKMDQKSIPELIAKCGSARLMVEVRQVRILPPGMSSSANSMGGGDYGAGGGYGGGGDYGGGGGDYGSEMGGMPTTTTTKEQFPLDLDVEIYGIIYIYNPPMAENLGVEKVTEETVIEGQAVLDGRKVEEPAATVTEAPVVPVPPVAAPESEPLPAPDAVPAIDSPDAAAPASPEAGLQPADAGAQPDAGAPVDAGAQPDAGVPVDPAGVPAQPAAGAWWVPKSYLPITSSLPA